MSSFMLRWLIFLLMNFGAGWLACLWTLRYLRGNSCHGWSCIASVWFSLFIGQIILVQTALGLVRWLSAPELAAVFLALAGASTLILRSDLSPENLRQFLPPLPAGNPAGWGGRGLLTTIFLAAWLSLGLALAALLEPSTAFDTYAYHLPMVADWYQAHALTPFYLPLAEIANSYFPGNGELLAHWFLAAFGTDLLARLPSLVMWVALGVASYRLCRQLGSSSISASLAVLLVLFTPVILSQATDLAQDLAAVALFTLALGHLLEFYRRPAWGSMALFAGASGAFAGVKYSGLIYLALLAAAWLVVLIVRREQLGLASLLAYGATFAGGVLALCGYWYGRNLVWTGNPLFPLQIKLLGRVIFAGPIDGYENQIWNHLGEIRPGLAGGAIVDSYGPYCGLLLLAAILLLLARWARGRRQASRGDGVAPGLIAGLLLVSVLVYVRTPYSVMRFTVETPITRDLLAAGARFSMASLVLGGVLIALALETQPRFVVWVIPLVNLSMIQGLLSGYDEIRYGYYGSRVFGADRLAMAAAILLGGAVLLAFHPARRWLSALSRRSRLTLAMLALLVAIPVTALLMSAVDGHQAARRYSLLRSQFGQVAEGWQWIDEHTTEARVAYTGGIQPYALYGRTLSNRVRYINIRGGLDDRWHDFYQRGQSYRQNGSYEEWLRNLRAWNARYVVVFAPFEIPEGQWVEARPAVFKRVFSNARVRIYETGL